MLINVNQQYSNINFLKAENKMEMVTYKSYNKYDNKIRRAVKYKGARGKSENSLRILLNHSIKNAIFPIKLQFHFSSRWRLQLCEPGVPSWSWKCNLSFVALPLPSLRGNRITSFPNLYQRCHMSNPLPRDN